MLGKPHTEQNQIFVFQLHMVAINKLLKITAKTINLSQLRASTVYYITHEI